MRSFQALRRWVLALFLAVLSDGLWAAPPPEPAPIPQSPESKSPESKSPESKSPESKSPESKSPETQPPEPKAHGHTEPKPEPVQKFTPVDMAAYTDAAALGDFGPKHIQDHVNFLAGPKLAGRGSGEPGLELAAEYLANKLAEFGLEPAGEKGTYFQPFEITVGRTLGKANRLLVRLTDTDTDTEWDFVPGDGFAPFACDNTPRAVAAPLVFAGYGITAREPERKLDYDDYAGLDVKGKIVLIWRYEPQEKDPKSVFNGTANTLHALFASKIENARKRGAAGVIFLTPGLHHQDDDPLDVGLQSGVGRGSMPVVFARRLPFENLFRLLGRDLNELARQTDATLRPPGFELPGVTAVISTEVTPMKKTVRNVLAKIPGRDPKLSAEWLVVGAHYDHLGTTVTSGMLDRSARGKPHYGADDNASGTAGVLELARLLARQREHLGRGVLFQFYAAEELGLFGSRHWVNAPTVPLSSVAAMINMDMIGRAKGNAVQVIGTQTSPAFKELATVLAKGLDLSVSTPVGGLGFSGSDHMSFEAKGIPVLFYFTGTHPDYHRPTDTPDKINSRTAAEVVRHAHRAVWQLSLQPERPTFAKSRPPADPHAGGGTPRTSGFRVYFGSIPDYAYEGRGVRLEGVAEGGPAQKAGLAAGDILLSFDAVPITSLDDFMVFLRTKKPNDVVEAEVKRGDATLKFKVTLGARP